MSRGERQKERRETEKDRKNNRMNSLSIIKLSRDSFRESLLCFILSKCPVFL